MAVEATNLEPQRHSLAEARQIGRMPNVSAMDGRARLAAFGRAPTIPANMGGDDEMTGAADDLVDAAARQG